MTFTIYLLRHAHAAWAQPGERDFDRSLDERGRKDAHRMANLFVRHDLTIDHVVCSTARRCVETLEVIQAGGALLGEVTFTDRLYANDHHGYVNEIASVKSGESVLFVGHNPMMADTVAALLAASETAPPKKALSFPTAALAVIELEVQAGGDEPTGPRRTAAPFSKARLMHFFTPKDAK